MTMNFKNALFSTADNTQIDMEIEHPVYGWLPFTADPDDVEEHGRELFVAATAIALPFVAPVYTVEELRAQMPSLTARQFWMAAANIDIDKDVIIETVKANMEDSIDRKIVLAELETSTFVRSSETIADIMAMLNIPAEQVDSLWTWAAGL